MVLERKWRPLAGQVRSPCNFFSQTGFEGSTNNKSQSSSHRCLLFWIVLTFPHYLLLRLFTHLQTTHFFPSLVLTLAVLFPAFWLELCLVCLPAASIRLCIRPMICGTITTLMHSFLFPTPKCCHKSDTIVVIAARGNSSTCMSCRERLLEKGAEKFNHRMRNGWLKIVVPFCFSI